MFANFTFIGTAILGYLIGSIPFGLVLCYVAGYGDIRKIGSKSTGATNVLRTGNKWLALFTVILDASKAGVLAFIASKILPNDVVYICGVQTTLSVLGAMIVGFCAFLGHNFSIWLKFKGGKGVASAFGLMLFLTPKIALFALAVWIVVAFAFRYSSLSAIIAALSVPFATFFLYSPLYTAFYTIVVAFVLVRHHANFARLFKGEESKISFSKKKKD